MHRGAGVHCHELRPWRIVVVAAWLAATLPMAAYARAADATELWPELSAYVGLSEDTRLFLDASYARGKESDLRTLELSAYLDVALAPMLRLELRKEDWQRARYLWVRVGYSHIGKVSAGDAQEPERRGVLALYARAPLPLEFWLEGRLRTDLRWIGNDYSTRYRARVDLSRDYRWLERPLMSYANAEVFYDTGQSGFNRTLYQIGTEVTVDKNFRYEVYLAWQSDRLPAPESLLALGLVAKWYFQSLPKIVVSTGNATRNIGAAMAPRCLLPSPDRHAVVMLVLALPISVLFAWLGTWWFGRHAEALASPAETRNA